MLVVQVTWYHNGRLIRPSNRYEMKITADGYVTLSVRIAFPEDAGHYTCCATNIMVASRHIATQDEYSPLCLAPSSNDALVCVAGSSNMLSRALHRRAGAH